MKKTITHAISILHRAPVAWNALQDKVKLDDALKSFSTKCDKQSVKKWGDVNLIIYSILTSALPYYVS